MNTSYQDTILAAADYLRTRLAAAQKEMPRVAVVLGSGLGKLADALADPLVIPYADIPGFRQSTAVGHKGNLLVGMLGKRMVLAMQGRFHYYEGYTMQEVTFPIRVMARLGVRTLMVSNAAGAMNPDYRVGDLVAITDHISFMPNPLIGPNMDDFGPRFPDMTRAYSPRLVRLADAVAAELGIAPLRHGVYVAETGPTYETPAEYRMFHLLGGDVVGMSTVPEVIVARHCGIEVFGMSVVTNQAADLDQGAVNDGDDVVHQADLAADRMTALFSQMVARLDHE